MKNKGITLVEVLIAIAILVIVLALCVLMLFGARKEARDVKRVSDIGVLRSAMTAVKVQYGSYLESGCEPGAVAACTGGRLMEVLNTISNFRDPSGSSLCVQNCTEECEYSFTEGMTDENFEVLFYLEKGIGNYSEKGCYALTELGVVKK